MMTLQRLVEEKQGLREAFPSERFAFVAKSDPRLEVIIPLEEYGAVYTVKVYGLNEFPQSEPIVTPGTILRDYYGHKMTEPDRCNHLLGTYNRETRLCLFSVWDPEWKLFETVQKAIMWLYAYHCHLQFGKHIECYLSH